MFENKVVAITGAGSGIGRALASALAARGARLALADIDEQSLAQTLRLLPADSEARAYPLDVACGEEVQRFAEEVVAHFGAVHYIVNNAGTSVLATVEHITLEEMDRVLAINLWGVIYGTKAFLPFLLRQREGCIVNLSSVFGLVATPCSVAYTISKFGVRGLTETLWQELDGTGVRAVLVHPGGIATNIGQSPRGRFAGDLELRINDGNLKRMTTTPEECARQILAGLERGKPRLLVGNGARALHWLSRLLPDRYGTLLRRSLEG